MLSAQAAFLHIRHEPTLRKVCLCPLRSALNAVVARADWAATQLAYGSAAVGRVFLGLCSLVRSGQASFKPANASSHASSFRSPNAKSLHLLSNHDTPFTSLTTDTCQTPR